MAFQPVHVFRVEMVGWFVKQQSSGCSRRSAERNAAALAAESLATAASSGKPSASIA